MVEYLDPSIASEGTHANSGFYGIDPTVVAPVTADDAWAQADVYQPFIEPPRVPDYAFVKNNGQGGKPHPLRKYFTQYTGVPYRFQPLPVWVYRAGHEARMLSTPKQAEAHGLKMAPNKLSLIASGDWSLEPVELAKFDPAKPGSGKSFQAKAGTATDQAALIAAAVAAAMTQMGGVPAKASASLPADAEFEAFKAWKASQAKVPPVTASALKPASVKLTPAEEKTALLKIAGEAGVKVKNDWGLDQIKAALDKAGK